MSTHVARKAANTKVFFIGRRTRPAKPLGTACLCDSRACIINLLAFRAESTRCCWLQLWQGGERVAQQEKGTEGLKAAVKIINQAAKAASEKPHHQPSIWEGAAFLSLSLAGWMIHGAASRGGAPDPRFGAE